MRAVACCHSNHTAWKTSGWHNEAICQITVCTWYQSYAILLDVAANDVLSTKTGTNHIDAYKDQSYEICSCNNKPITSRQYCYMWPRVCSRIRNLIQIETNHVILPKKLHMIYHTQRPITWILFNIVQTTRQRCQQLLHIKLQPIMWLFWKPVSFLRHINPSFKTNRMCTLNVHVIRQRIIYFLIIQ
jgi:hypothetical protein